MEHDHSPLRGPSRRELLLASAAAAGGGTAALLASCGGSSKKKTPSTETVSTTQAQSDSAILAALLDMENSAIAAYLFLQPKLSGRALATARSFLVHERAHAAALGGLIVQLGGEPARPQPRSEYDSNFPALRNARDALSLALDVESTAISAYADALPQIVTDDIRVTLGSILVTEAEHSAVLLGDLGRPRVPDPFVTGPPPDPDA
jgi:rubrerythrin